MREEVWAEQEGFDMSDEYKWWIPEKTYLPTQNPGLSRTTSQIFSKELVQGYY